MCVCGFLSQSMRLTASNMRKFEFIGRKLNEYRAASAIHTMNNNILNLTVSPVAIAIIGAGFSGSLVAANLLRNATIPLSIKLIERNSEVGRGVAYGTPVDCHLLNVPAGKMSAYGDEPNHFLNWLHRNGYEQVTQSTFVPRRVYGDYVQATLKVAQLNAAANVQLEKIVDEAIAIETKPNSTIIYLSSGQYLDVQKAVLANCDYRRLQHPLVASLQEQRSISPNRLSMGIDTAPNGALIDADGNTSQMLYTLGTPRKGNLWETTAVPEIRSQAANLAQELLKSLNPKSSAANFLLRKPAMLFRQLFDKESSTYTYLIADPESKIAILVDPVLEQVERDLQVLRQLGLTLRYCLETHIHADHITGTDRLRTLTSCLGIVPENAGATYSDRYIADGNILELGNVQIEAIATPGHTDSHIAYLVNDTHLLTGDALFIRGCGRTDFQNGDAGSLYNAVTQKLFTLPDDTLVYPGHDYQGQTVSTIGEEKSWNPRFAGRSRNQFIELMKNLNLPQPKKMPEAVPANQHCGRVLVALDYQI